MDFNLNFDEMIKNVESVQGPLDNKFGPDPRFWKISRNDKDQGIAIIRLLPSFIKIDGKESVTPFIRVYRHNINLKEYGVKKFYDMESPSSIGLPCAVSDLYKELGKIGTDESEKLKKCIRRSTKFISNVYIKKDPLKPENDSKIKLWEFGTKLKDKFQLAAKPSQEEIALGTKPVNLWDPVNGADIKLTQKKSGGFYNYDDTQIMTPAPLMNFASGDELAQWIRENTIALDEWLEPDHYITYEEQCDKLRFVFEGSKVEDYLKSIGSFLYGGKPQTINETQDTIQNVNQITQENTQEIPTESVQKTEPEVTQSNVSDDLDFLDEI